MQHHAATISGEADALLNPYATNPAPIKFVVTAFNGVPISNATDLTAQVRSFIALLAGRAGRVVAELIGQAQTDPELAAAFRERYSSPRRALAVGVLGRARERGQIRDDVDLEVVVDQLWGAGYHRLLIPDQPLTAEFADALVRTVLAGLRPNR